MGMFAEKAIVDYRLLFADQGKQTSVFCFCLQQTNQSFLFAENKRNLPFLVSSVFCLWKHRDMYMDTWRHGDKKTWKWRHGNIET
jgi:hypothetical protein